MKRGWFNDSVRHSLAAKGVKTNYFARRRRLLTSQIAESAKEARRRSAGLDMGSRRERAAAALTSRRSLSETPLSEEQREEIERQNILDEVQGVEQKRRVESSMLDQEIASSLNIPVGIVNRLGTGGERSFAAQKQALENADLANVDQEKAIAVIDKRIRVENEQSSPNKTKIRLLQRARELARMSPEARLQETAREGQRAAEEARKRQKKAPSEPKSETINVPPGGFSASTEKKKKAKSKRAPKRKRSPDIFIKAAKADFEKNPKVKNVETGEIKLVKKRKKSKKATKQSQKDIEEFLRMAKSGEIKV